MGSSVRGQDEPKMAGLRAASCQYQFSYPFLTKLVWSNVVASLACSGLILFLLFFVFVFACLFVHLDFVSVHKHPKIRTYHLETVAFSTTNCHKRSLTILPVRWGTGRAVGTVMPVLLRVAHLAKRAFYMP